MLRKLKNEHFEVFRNEKSIVEYFNIEEKDNFVERIYEKKLIPFYEIK